MAAVRALAPKKIYIDRKRIRLSMLGTTLPLKLRSPRRKNKEKKGQCCLKLELATQNDHVI